MTRRWSSTLWAVPALGWVAIITLRSDGGGPAPAPATVADLAPCSNCTARHHHIGRIAEARQTGALP